MINMKMRSSIFKKKTKKKQLHTNLYKRNSEISGISFHFIKALS